MTQETAIKAEESRKLQQEVNQVWPAFALMGLGGTLLLANIFNWHLMELVWPGFVIAPGLLLLWPAANSTASQQRRLAFLAVPGAMVTAVGVLLAMMNITGYFEAWAYSWPLVIAAAAGGMMYLKRFEPNHTIHERGYKFIRVMVMVFIGLVIFFEVLIFENYSPLLSLGLIGYGVYMLAKQRRTAAKLS